MMANFIGRRIRIVTGDGGRTYEGNVHLLDQQTGQISLQRVLVVDTGKKLTGSQTFFGADISSIEVLEEDCKKPEDVSQGKREKGPRLLHSKYVPAHLERIRDFEPTNHLFKTAVKDDVDATPKSVGKSSDYDSSSDQELFDFEDCIYLSKINQKFYDAINHLKEQSEIGVSFSGVCIGRDGKLSLIQMATNIDVFVFDVVTLGSNCWEAGLKSIFESPNISKVFHDCRFPSDILHHQYGISLINIFDTQVAEVFVYRLYHNGGWPKWVNGLSCSLFDHLSLSTDMVNNLKIRENLKKEDQLIWMNRPISKNLLKVAIKEVIHLLQLRHILTEKMMGEYVAGVDVYLAQVREASKEDVKKYQNNAHKLPVAFENLSGLLAGRDSHRYNRHRYNRGPPCDDDMQKDINGFMENCRGIIGTDVCYSNSSIWHEGSKIVAKSIEESTKSEKLSPDRPSTATAVDANQSDMASPVKRTSVLKTPPAVLADLKKTIQSIQTTSNSTAAEKSCENSCENSDKEMSVGQLMRSNIKYHTESDIDLVPAGMTVYKNRTLHKPKQKRLDQIDQMSSQLENARKKENKKSQSFLTSNEESWSRSKGSRFLDDSTDEEYSRRGNITGNHSTSLSSSSSFSSSHSLSDHHLSMKDVRKSLDSVKVSENQDLSSNFTNNRSPFNKSQNELSETPTTSRDNNEILRPRVSPMDRCKNLLEAMKKTPPKS